ncbi:hypothetical protein SAMN02745174_01684 [Cetobacterium ceti]|uniref:Tetratricopeptide repeat-containing protein n=1 Tax=Cetobacterium ceti TaxID=180163 RepID=A0A1T4NXL2_9FUSO|nr:hypothetical protein [Cetobacterium ceti]SJZ83538.1 hypothetical protein SAMN02745174_01684 [Cetobacterium ceti]
MQEKDRYQEAILKMNENKISDAQLLLQNTRSYENQKFLGILCCIKGEFDKAYHIFFKLSKIKEEKNIIEYLEYLEKSIKNRYIPLFNKLISNIKSNTNSNTEEIIIQLENICKNTELYSLAVIFFLRKKDTRKAQIYYKKLKLLDNSSEILGKVDLYFAKKSFNDKKKFIYGASILAIIGFSSIIYQNNFLKKIVNKEKIENSFAKKIKAEEIAFLNKKLLEKEKEILKIKAIQEEIKFQDKNLLITNDELYNVALKRIKQKEFKEAIKIFNVISFDRLPEFKKREMIFQKARAYERLNIKEKALENYEKYLQNSGKNEYEIYIKIVQKQVEKLKKEME